MNLWPQLFVSAALLCLMALVHAFGVLMLTHILGLDGSKLRAHRVDLAAIGISVGMALGLFSLHIIEILIFAGFYMAVDAIDTFEAALFFSASSYATLGQPEVQFPEHWRLVGAFEGLVGFLFIGWSTGVFISDMNKLLRE